jgi:uncharacterized membrane-anchored protein YhcB (DUF1043 family)
MEIFAAVVTILTFVIGIIISAIKIISYIKESGEQQRKENREDHSKLFDKLGVQEQLVTKHTVEIETIQNQLHTIKS